MKVIHLEGGKQKALDLRSEEYKNYTGVKEIEDNLFDADDEDLTISTESGQRKIRLKDTPYNVNFSGLGKKILRRNIVSGKNILTQSDFNLQNTVYVIKHDFDLNGSTITIPNRCTLYFQGGSIANGIVNGFNTEIKTDVKCAIFKDVFLKAPNNLNGTDPINGFYYTFFGTGYDWMTSCSTRDDDYLKLNNLLQFTKQIVEDVNELNIKTWINPYYTGGEINKKNIATRSLNFDGNGVKINILVDDYSVNRPFESNQADYRWGINSDPYNFIDIGLSYSNSNRTAKVIFKNVTITDSKEENGFGSNFTQEFVTYTNPTTGVTYTANNRCGFFGLTSFNKNVDIQVSGVNFKSRAEFMSGNIGYNQQTVLGRVLVSNSHFYTLKNFIFELWSSSNYSFKSATYINCSFKSHGVLAFNSNASIAESENYYNCKFHSVYGNAGANESMANRSYNFYNCNFLNAGAIDYFSSTAKVNTTCIGCYFDTDETDLVGFYKGGFYNLINSGVTKYINCKINIGKKYNLQTSTYTSTTETTDEIYFQDCSINVVIVSINTFYIPAILHVLNSRINNNIISANGSTIALPFPSAAKKHLYYQNESGSKNNASINSPTHDIMLNRNVANDQNRNVSLLLLIQQKTTGDIFIGNYMYYANSAKTFVFSNKYRFYGNYFTLDVAVKYDAEIEYQYGNFHTVSFSIGQYTFTLIVTTQVQLKIADSSNNSVTIVKNIKLGEHTYSFSISHLPQDNRVGNLYCFVDGNMESDTNTVGSLDLKTVDFGGSLVGDANWSTAHAKAGVKYLALRNFSLL